MRTCHFITIIAMGLCGMTISKDGHTQPNGEPLAISYQLHGSIDPTGLSPTELTQLPRECVIDFHYSAPTARVVMESPDGLINYLDRIFPLQVQAFPDSTYVYGQPGSWTIGLGHFSGISAFRVRVLNANSQAPIPVAIAEGMYP